MFKAQCILLVVSAVVLGTFADDDCETFCKTMMDETNKLCEKAGKCTDELTKKVTDVCAAECPKCIADEMKCVEDVTKALDLDKDILDPEKIPDLVASFKKDKKLVKHHKGKRSLRNRA